MQLMEMVAKKRRRVFNYWSRHLLSVPGLCIILICLSILLIIVQVYNLLRGSAKHQVRDPSQIISQYHVQIPTIFGLGRATHKKSQMVPVDERLAVLVMAANRPEAIANHLAQIKRLRKHPNKFPIVVSQDGNVETVSQAIVQFVNSSANAFHIQVLVFSVKFTGFLAVGTYEMCLRNRRLDLHG
uniref:Alpha-1,3-mannosyl-glycoprotein 2-beta-N-acetylglucosaminyltransferase n=1 Tax=Ditylenchus dipsaci TaxID=166011 RepID=A0A915ET08_9BILA